MDYKLLLGISLLVLLFAFFRPTNVISFEARTGLSEKAIVEANELTIYSNYGFFKDIYNISLPLGASSLEFAVPSTIDISSLFISDLSDPTTTFFKKTFIPASDNEAKIISQSLHQNITLHTNNATITGELISFGNNVVLKTESGTIIIPKESILKIESPFTPESQSKVVTTVLNNNIGNHRLLLSYLLNGVSWEANHIVFVSDSLSIDTIMQINNNAGIDFNNVSLKFVAGDVNRRNYYPSPMQAYDAYSKEFATVEGISSESFSDYYLYSLDKTTTLRDGETTQVTMHSIKNIPYEKIFVFAPSESAKVKTNIKFENKQNANVPLPAGTVKVYQADTSGAIQFIGESQISHTPKNSNITLAIGYAFDLVANRTSTSHRVTNCTSTTSYLVQLRNEKEESAKITVFERFYGDWSIVSESEKNKLKTAETVEWDITIPSKQTKSLEYTILQRWCE